MRKSFFDKEHNRLYIKRTGPVSLEDFCKGIEEVLKQPFVADIDCWVTDLLEADVSSITSGDVNKLADIFSEKLSHVNFVLIVSVINFGFSNMFCTLAGLKESHVFFDTEKALEFLGIPELPLY